MLRGITSYFSKPQRSQGPDSWIQGAIPGSDRESAFETSPMFGGNLTLTVDDVLVRRQQCSDPLHPELANCEIYRVVHGQEVSQSGNLQCRNALLRKSRQRQPFPGVAAADE